MKGKKKNKRDKEKDGVQFIVLKDIHKYKHEVTVNEEATMVKVFYTTGNHRHPVQYWKLIRNKNVE